MQLRYADKVRRIAGSEVAVARVTFRTKVMSRWIRTEFHFVNMALRLLSHQDRDDRFRERSTKAAAALREIEAVATDWEARCKQALGDGPEFFEPPPSATAEIVLLNQKASRLLSACLQVDFVLFATSILVVRGRMVATVRDSAHATVEEMLDKMKAAATRRAGPPPVKVG